MCKFFIMVQFKFGLSLFLLIGLSIVRFRKKNKPAKSFPSPGLNNEYFTVYSAIFLSSVPLRNQLLFLQYLDVNSYCLLFAIHPLLYATFLFVVASHKRKEKIIGFGRSRVPELDSSLKLCPSL